MLNKSKILMAAAALAIITPLPATAYDPASTAAVNVDKAGVGLRGYDPVAYFKIGAPQRGNASFSASHNGVTYHFADAANRDLFKSRPEAFAPQFGGFCETGVSLKKKLDGDPDVWRVADGKLYVYINRGAMNKLLEDPVAGSRTAVANWPQIKDKAPKDL